MILEEMDLQHSQVEQKLKPLLDQDIILPGHDQNPSYEETLDTPSVKALG